MSEEEKEITAAETAEKADAAAESAQKDQNDKTGNTEQKKTARVRNNKFHGARKSKIDPELMMQMQHTENKLRIVRIFVMLLITAIFFSVIWLFVDYLQNRAERNARMTEMREQLKTYEQSFSEKNEALYDSAVSAVKAIRLAEDLIAYASKTCSTSEAEAIYHEMQDRIKEYEKVVLRSNCNGEHNFVSGSVMLDMVFIPGGIFKMGSAENDNLASPNEFPQNLVKISKPFWMARTEVTFWQFRKLLPTFQVKNWDEFKLDQADQPAVRMTWDQAMAFCQALTARERQLGRIPAGYEYRLPTEAEWEYACRGGRDAKMDQTQFYWGNEFGDSGSKFANSLDLVSAKRLDRDLSEEWSVADDDKFIVSAPVASFAPNGFGLYDMSGNVAEWCIDFYDPAYYRKADMLRANTSEKIITSPKNMIPVSVAYESRRNADTTNFTSDTPCRVIRGGNWGNIPQYLRSARRDYMPQQNGDNGVGFRPVLAPVIETKQKSEWAL